MFRVLILFILLIASTAEAKYWNGSAWVDTTAKRYNGSAWVDVDEYRYNGATWDQINDTGSGEPPVSVLTKLAHTTGTATGSTTLSINVPTVYDGNLLTLSVVNDDGGSITTPSGWTSRGSVVSGTSTHAMFSRIASSEPASYTITNNTSGDLVAVMTSWQKPSGTWAITASTVSRPTNEQPPTAAYDTPDNSMVYVGWPNDAGYSITGGPYIGSSGTTSATNMVSIARSNVGSISIDTFNEPMGSTTGTIRNVIFSASEDSAIGVMVISYE